MLSDVITRLLEFKKSRKLTWDGISEMSGMSVSTLKKVGCGIREDPRIKTVEQIERFLVEQEKKSAA